MASPKRRIPAAVAKRLLERAAEDDTNVFDRVMVVYMKVAGGLDPEIEEAVAGEALEHVVEKRHAGAISLRPEPSSCSVIATRSRGSCVQARRNARGPGGGGTFERAAADTARRLVFTSIFILGALTRPAA